MKRVDSTHRVAGTDRESRRILVLSDDPEMLSLLVDSLGPPSLDLVACSELEAAECLLGNEAFDVLIADLEASGRQGYGELSILGDLVRDHPAMRVIVVSARIDDATRKLGRSLGVTEILDKTADLDCLRKLVEDRESLGRRSPTRQPSSFVRVETLEELLEMRSVTAALEPVMALRDAGAQDLGFGVEGIPLGPVGSPLRSSAVLLDYAARKGRLFDAEMRCLKAVLFEAGRLPSIGKLFLEVRPQSLSSSSFVQALRQVVRDHGLHETEVVLVLSERRSTLDPGALELPLKSLRRAGFSLALAHYGSGLANLDLLQILDFNYLRIDGRFTRGLQYDPRKQAIVRATVVLADELGIATIMECVESNEELDMVRRLGVDFAQGRYFSEPLPADELAETFRSVVPLPAGVLPLIPRAQDRGFENDAEHELSNLLTAMALVATLGIKKLRAEHPLHEDLELIRQAGEKAVSLSHEIREGKHRFGRRAGTQQLS